jgi:hypothetical protein
LSIETLIESLLPFRFLNRERYSQGVFHVLWVGESDLAPRISANSGNKACQKHAVLVLAMNALNLGVV